MTIVQMVALGMLVVMFVISAWKNINVGMLGFVASYILGCYLMFQPVKGGGMQHLSDKDVLANFPGFLVTIIIGVTLFFGMARTNGTIDLIVRVCIRAVRGRTAVVPWVFFLLASFLTAMGTFNPAAVALLAPAAMAFAKKARVNPLVMGVLLVNGVHAGGYSPISVAGVIVHDLALKGHVPVDGVKFFLASYFINTLLSALTVFGDWLWRRHKGRRTVGQVDLSEITAKQAVTFEQKLTLVLIALLLIATLVFKMSIGFIGIAAALVLIFLNSKRQAAAIAGVSWHTVIMIAGMMTYVGLLQQAGVIAAVSNAAVKLGNPLLVVLLLCLLIGLLAGFVSSTALLTAFVPLAAPILLAVSNTGAGGAHMTATGVIAALAISGTIVDVSPFASDGALVIANTDDEDRDRLYRHLLPYTLLIMLAGSVLTWALLVPTHVI